MNVVACANPNGPGTVPLDLDDPAAIAAYKTQIEAAKHPAAAANGPLRLDLGCGNMKKEGFLGVDIRQFTGVDLVCDLGAGRWPWEDNSVDEVSCGHLVEHLKPAQRIHFVNELHRVLKKGAKAQIVTPHWGSCRAYGDLTHEWPPVSEFWFFYLGAAWRKQYAEHNDEYTCDFDHVISYVLNPKLVSRSPEHQQHAIEFFKESAMDMISVLVKK